jgi:hypothetical protein
VHTALAPAASGLPARSPPRTVCPACDPRQFAVVFNQPLSWDTSSVTDMDYMFSVRCSPRPAPRYLQPRALSPARSPARVAPHTSSALLATRQGGNSLSATNKLLIRCAWAGNPEFNRRYGSSWAPGSCA